MRKGQLRDGRPFIGITIEHFVKLTDFAKALACYYWHRSEDFPVYLQRTEAMRILKEGLFHYGLNGSLDTTLWEGSANGLDGYASHLELALKWVSKNYPYLNH